MSEVIPVRPKNKIWNYAIMYSIMNVHKINISKNLVMPSNVMDTKDIIDIKNKQKQTISPCS